MVQEVKGMLNFKLLTRVQSYLHRVDIQNLLGCHTTVQRAWLNLVLSVLEIAPHLSLFSFSLKLLMRMLAVLF